MSYKQIQWKKASYSFANSNCVEMGVWKKASGSFANSNCVEATSEHNVVLVRDTKRSRIDGDSAPVQVYSLDQWQRLIDILKYGSYSGAIDLGNGVTLTLKQVRGMTHWHLSGQTTVHHYTQAEMDAFIQGVKDGEFDLAPELELQLAAV